MIRKVLPAIYCAQIGRIAVVGQSCSPIWLDVKEAARSSRER
jgi:hypothetical protein